MKLGHRYGEVQIDIHRLYVCTIILELREVSIRPKGKRSGIRWLILIVYTFFFIFYYFFLYINLEKYICISFVSTVEKKQGFGGEENATR